jgi:hypothetical protein
MKYAAPQTKQYEFDTLPIFLSVHSKQLGSHIMHVLLLETVAKAYPGRQPVQDRDEV